MRKHQGWCEESEGARGCSSCLAALSSARAKQALSSPLLQLAALGAFAVVEGEPTGPLRVRVLPVPGCAVPAVLLAGVRITRAGRLGCAVAGSWLLLLPRKAAAFSTVLLCLGQS